ncbi:MULTISPECIES: zinc-dependent alcohol dehydrogenase family protein [unclassified Nocardioides]|uniref:zinc-dependent alcohol dehydrogenase family protein n=1 Tax=unclassified Nocardioides TaxID=2615069 RepID=UPI00361CC242
MDTTRQSRPMAAWVVETPGPMPTRPLARVERRVSDPSGAELLVAVEACGICRTDLHLAEGDLAPRRPGTTPGHQVVGRVAAVGPATERFTVGDRVGAAWLRSTCGECRWCRSGRENLCPASTYTGWDADGGFAEYILVPAPFAYRLPEDLPATALAPLLCAGIIGYRALARTNLPAGGRLGIYGFGSSAHLVAQIALARGAELFVASRGEGDRALALRLGASWAGAAAERPPVALDGAIVFAPAGELVPVALEAVGPGGTVVLAGIHMSTIPAMEYDDLLFGERDLRSVTANTRRDGEELLRLAERLGIQPTVTTYPFDAADRALTDLAAGRLSGSAVLVVDR